MELEAWNSIFFVVMSLLDGYREEILTPPIIECMYVCIYIYYKCVWVCAHIDVYTYNCTYTHIHIYIYIYTHTHTTRHTYQPQENYHWFHPPGVGSQEVQCGEPPAGSPSHVDLKMFLDWGGSWLNICLQLLESTWVELSKETWTEGTAGGGLSRIGVQETLKLSAFCAQEVL